MVPILPYPFPAVEFAVPFFAAQFLQGGLSSLDVPDGSTQPTLEFTIFVPTSEFFRVMRVNAASLDYVKAGQGGGTASSVPQPFWPAGEFEPADASDDGLERFLTATRRQNFLIPPRRHRSFPLLELT